MSLSRNTVGLRKADTILIMLEDRVRLAAMVSTSHSGLFRHRFLFSRQKPVCSGEREKGSQECSADLGSLVLDLCDYRDGPLTSAS